MVVSVAVFGPVLYFGFVFWRQCFPRASSASPVRATRSWSRSTRATSPPGSS